MSHHHSWLFALLLAPAALAAAPAARVEGLQMPAWLERGATRAPLAPGAELASSDRIVTGSGARVLLRLEEGSTVKLGADATLNLEKLAPPATGDGVFEGVLDVLKGAFRFTTTAIGKARKRDVTARVATATIGIRGTDVWGKAEAERDFVVLLEGAITITRDGQTVEMTEANSLFMAPKNQPALPVGPVNPDDLGRWAQETELQAGNGVLGIDGEWRVHLAAFRDAAAADAARTALADAGYATTPGEATIDGVHWVRLDIAGYSDRTEALAAAKALTGRHGIVSPWVERAPP